MELIDILYIIRWWLVFFVIGLIFLPLTFRIFSNFFDKGYIFSRILGMALISYVVFLLGILKILPFNSETILFVIGVTIAINIFIFLKVSPSRRRDLIRSSWKIFLFEEILFLATLIFWSYIRAHEPSIHGLEKYMDFGFVNSIIRSEHFPPRDMWFTPHSINYYYFGHLVTAVLTKLSGIPSSITYNLMLSTIFALTFTASFSIGLNLFNLLTHKRGVAKVEGLPTARTFVRSEARLEGALAGGKLLTGPRAILAGLLSGFLVSMAGNLHSIYTFFKPYVNENPVPFWQLAFSFNTFPNSYWYPNATRFIHNTIHEFPIYSFVVSDLHGHFLDIPFVLFTIALLFSLLLRLNNHNDLQTQNSKLKTQNYGSTSSPSRAKSRDSSKLKTFIFNSFAICDLRFAILLAFMLAIMYMTNAWDGIIYFILAILILFYLNLKISPSNNIASKVQSAKLKVQNYLSTLSSRPKGSLKLKVFSFELSLYALRFALYAVTIMFGFFIFSLPFNFYFKPFASGIGVLCAPEFLTNIGKLGPFLFEKDHCLRSPIWQLSILYGFFYFWVVSFLISILRNVRLVQNAKLKIQNYGSTSSPSRAKSRDNSKSKTSNFGLRLLTFNFELLTKSDIFILLLIILSTLLIIIPEFIYIKDIYPGHYRANTMFKLVYQAFMMLSIASAYIAVRLISSRQIRDQISNWKLVVLVFIGSIGLLLVSVYPYFAINSYYNLKTYQGLDGIKYLKTLYPTDYEGILWINKNIKGQPVILEAQGDSYTDYARVSSNTGLPTVLGWAVHEWLWRGSYDIPSPRIPEVQTLYEAETIEDTKKLINKYKIKLVFIGNLEKEKYPNLNEEKFKRLGKVIYENGRTKIYEITF